MVFKNLNNLLKKITEAHKKKKSFIVNLKTLNCLKVMFLLKNEGFILGFSFFSVGVLEFIKIFLKYCNMLPVIAKIKIVSKPSKRIFLRAKSLTKFNANYSLLVLNTPKGLLSDKQCRFFNVGGEVIFFLN